MRKPTVTQSRVAAFLAEVAAECSARSDDTAADYFKRVGTEFEVSPAALALAAAGDANAISCTDARMLSRAIGPM